jgi:hypothetical protein
VRWHGTELERQIVECRAGNRLAYQNSIANFPPASRAPGTSVFFNPHLAFQQHRISRRHCRQRGK